MSYFEATNILLLITNGILVPVILYYVASGKQARAAGFTEITTKLEHLDKCFDLLRIQVAGSGATRVEVLDLRKEMLEEFSRQDLARHELATRIQILVDSVDQRLTRQIERITDSMVRPPNIGGC